jgi:hypothetical protein
MDRHWRVFELDVRSALPAGVLNPGVRLGINTQAERQRTLKRPGDHLTRPGRFPAEALNPGVRLGLNPQAERRRTLKRLGGFLTTPGRLSGLRCLARGFTPGRALFAESDALQGLIVEDLEGLG